MSSRLGAIVALLSAGFVFSLSAEVLRQVPYRGAIAADKSGRVLFEDSADARAFPASVSKLMTALLVLEDLRAQRYTTRTLVTATEDVAFSEPSWIGLKKGDRMSVRDLLYALMILSANDGAIALAVHSEGSLEAFVARMNRRAKELGMSSTRYYSPNGLPPNAKLKYPWTAYNVSTARDQLKLALELLKYPEILRFTSTKACDLVSTPTGFRISLKTPVLQKDEKLVQHLTNHNNIMCKPKLIVVNEDGSEAVDGFKTGYIDDGGSSIVLTGSYKGCRVVVVVLGSDGIKDLRGRTLKKSVEVRDSNARRIFVDALGAVSW